jgi:hypothetical protein
MGPAGFGDASQVALTRLADLGVQTEMGDDVGAREAGEVSNGGHDRQRHHRVDAGDGHQPGDDGIAESLDGQLAVDGLEFGAKEVELADQRLGTAPLIAGQLLLGEPVPAARPNRSLTGQVGAGCERTRLKSQVHAIL